MKLFIIVLLIASLSLGIFYAFHYKKQLPAQPCSLIAKPCIELDDRSGNTIARFNDFRFCGLNCIAYQADGHWKRYDQPYHLKWIGPIVAKCYNMCHGR